MITGQRFLGPTTLVSPSRLGQADLSTDLAQADALDNEIGALTTKARPTPEVDDLFSSGNFCHALVAVVRREAGTANAPKAVQEARDCIQKLRLRVDAARAAYDAGVPAVYLGEGMPSWGLAATWLAAVGILAYAATSSR